MRDVAESCCLCDGVKSSGCVRGERGERLPWLVWARPIRAFCTVLCAERSEVDMTIR